MGSPQKLTRVVGTLGHWYLPRREELHCSPHQEDQREGCQQACLHDQQDRLQGRQVCPQVSGFIQDHKQQTVLIYGSRVAASVVASTAKHYYRPDIRQVCTWCQLHLIFHMLTFIGRMLLPVSLPSSNPSVPSRLTRLLS